MNPFLDFESINNTNGMTIMNAIEKLIIKKHGKDASFDVIAEPDNNEELKIFWNREVVEDGIATNQVDFDANKKISLTDARKIDPSFEIGEEVMVLSFVFKNIVHNYQCKR